jgi:hypothetical protein
MSPVFASSIARLRARTALVAGVAGLAALVIALTGFRRTITVPSLGPHAGVPPVPATERVTLAYTARFAGVGAEGVDNVWVGRLSGPTPGEITLRVEHLGAEAERAKPVWPIRVLTFVAADNVSRSFAADLTGTLDWRTGTMRLSGTVNEGWRSGAPAEQVVRIDPVAYDGQGTLDVGAVQAMR